MPSYKALSLSRYWRLASALSGVSPTTQKHISNENLIDSALNAPFAEFGGQRKYSSLAELVGVLGFRLIANHGLPDRNKRTAVAAMVEFTEINDAVLDLSDEDAVFDAVTSVAAGSLDEPGFIAFIEERLTA